MASLIYAPAIQVRVETDKYGIIDISDDVTTWTLTRRVDAVSTFSFTVQNAQRKYDGIFKPQDRITVALKRITWVHVFTGSLNNSPVFSAWPRALPLSASCTLKKLQFWPWDPTTSAAATLFSNYFGANSNTNSSGDGGLSKLIIDSLTQVTDWPKADIHIGQVPNDWFKFIAKTEAEIDTATTMQYAIGSGAVLGVQAQGGGVLPVGRYAGSSITSEQAANAITIYNTAFASGIPDPATAATIAICTAMTESSLNNLSGGDGSSLGLFQQTDQGYGSAAEREDPVHATKAFLSRLKAIPSWQLLPIYEACQQVQRSGAGQASDGLSNYGKFVAFAQAIVVQLGKGNSGLYQPRGAHGQPVPVVTPTTPVKKLPGIKAGTPHSYNTDAAPPPAGVAGETTGGELVGVGVSLLKDRASNPILYQNSSATDVDTTPEASLKYLDCSAFVNWVYYHATGRHLQPTGQHYSGTQYAECIPIPVELAYQIQGAAIFITEGGVPGGGHVAIALGQKDSSGQWLHMAAHTSSKPPSEQVSIEPVYSGFTNGGLLPHIDYTQAASTTAAAAQLKQYLNGQATTVGQTTTYQGDSTTLPALSQLVSALATPPTVNGDVFGGARQLMNNEPFLPWLKALINSSMRNFCSAPNGDIIAWFPDYFGLWGTAASMNIELIELQDFTVDWSDQQIVTHEYVVGSQNPLLDAASGSIVDGSDASYAGLTAMLATQGVVTMDFPQIFQAIYGQPVSQKFVSDYLKRFGGRPNVENYSNIRVGPQEFFMAMFNFMQYWANQFSANIPLTFMPELWPGMLLKIPAYDFQCYVSEVTHTGNYGSDGGGFTTTATISAPARMSNKTDTFGLLPLAGS